MLTLFIVCLCLATNLHAGDIKSSTIANDGNHLLDGNRLYVSPTTTLSAPPFDEEAELAKIAASCFSSSNFEQLSGYAVRRLVARILGNILIQESVVVIGLTELRATLNLAPLPPWRHYNDTHPSDGDLAAAPTVQAYYDLKEPRSHFRSLDNDYLFEHNIAPAVAYLDQRFPSIRSIFRRRLEEELRRAESGVVDRKTVDRMIKKFSQVHDRLYEAVRQMTPGRDGECWDD